MSSEQSPLMEAALPTGIRLLGQGRQATVTLALLFASLILSYADRAVFALSLRPIKAALVLSDSQLGLLSGLAFAASYAVFSPLAGWFGDRYSRKRVLLAAIAAWSLATVATAFADSFATMFLARSFVGMGEAAVMPLAASILADTRPDVRSRDRAFGIYMNATMLGSVVALLFGGTLVQSMLPVAGLAPWQSVFVLAGLAGVAMIAVTAATMVDPGRSQVSGSNVVKPVRSSAWQFARGNPRLLATLFIGFSFMQLAYATTLGWVVLALERRHGWSAGQSAVNFALTAGLATLVGTLLVQPLVQRTRERGAQGAPLIVGALFCLAFGVFVAAGLVVQSGALSLALLAIGFFFGLGPATCSFVYMGDVLPSSNRAQLAGFNTLSISVICNTLGPYLVGMLSDRAFRTPAGVADALAAVDLGAAVIGAVIVLAGRRVYAASIAPAMDAARVPATALTR